MDESPHNSNAWQPFTFGGVARFAYAKVGRLFLACILTAALCGGVVIWFLNLRWVPAIETAIANLPEHGSIRNGSLRWPNSDTDALAQTSFLGISVQAPRSPELSSGADLEFVFDLHELRIHSFFGHLPLAYPTDFIISLNRPEVQPGWGAWKQTILGGAGVLSVLLLLLSWSSLGLLYVPLIKLLGFYSDRSVSLVGSWKCGVAAMLMSALLLTLSLVLYGLQEISFLGLMVAFVGHFGAQFLYVMGSIMALDRIPDVRLNENPFQEKPSDPAGPSE